MLCRRRFHRRGKRPASPSLEGATESAESTPASFCRRCRLRGNRRRGVAAVEMAVLLPLIVFMFVLGVDFARIFYYSLTVTNAARNGAMHAADVNQSPYDSIEEAVLSDSQNLSPRPTITVSRGRGTGGQPYTDVTVSYEFRTVTNYLKATTPITIVRKVRTPVLPLAPDF